MSRPLGTPVRATRKGGHTSRAASLDSVTRLVRQIATGPNGVGMGQWALASASGC
jgi:hypothetical protein